MISLWGFATENDLLSLFCLIWIKTHFPLYNPFVYLRRSLFNRLAQSAILWSTESSDVSSAKTFTFEFRPLGKSLMLTENSKGSINWPSGNARYPHDKCWLFNTTLCFLQLKKSFIKVISSPNIRFSCNSKSKPSCQTLSNALDISRKTPLTSWPSSYAERISCAIGSNWLVQESSGLNPDCFSTLGRFLKKMKTCRYKVTVQTLYHKPGEEKLERHFL